MTQAQASTPTQSPAPVPVYQDVLREFREAVPVRLRKNVSNTVLRKVNEVLQDSELHEGFRENLLSYTQVLTEGRFKLTSYVDAVRYVSYKMLGHTNIRAYSMTFPERVNKWLNDGVSSKDIASHVASYNKNRLVNLILEQCMVPLHILNRDNYQKAINHQLHLMYNAKSEKVQSDAANSLMHHLKPPESAKLEIQINESEDSAVSELRAQTAALIAQQKAMINAGMLNAAEVAKQKIVSVEAPGACTVLDPIDPVDQAIDEVIVNNNNGA